MLIADALLVDAHAGDGQHAILLLEPAAVQLVIRDDPEEDDPEGDGEEARYEEDDLPGFDGRAVSLGADCDAVCHESSEELAPAIETEPDVDATALFLFGVPLQMSVAGHCIMGRFQEGKTYLRGQQSKSRSDGCFKNT